MKTRVPLIAIAALAEYGSVIARTLTIPLQSRALISWDKDTRWRVPGEHRKWATLTGVKIPLKDYFNRTDNQWYSHIKIGEPAQDFKVLWDTGSVDLLIPESNCTTCGDHDLFNPSASTTFSPLPGTPFDIEFSTGADSIPFLVAQGATGHVVTDTISVGDLKSANQTFLLADSYAQALDAMPIDGIIGMSPPNVSSIGTPFFWNLYESGQLDSPIFSFYTPPYPSYGAEIMLGGIDESKLEGAISYTSLNAELSGLAGSYVIDLPAIYAGRKLLGNSSDGVTPLPAAYAFLDTGTAFMQTPDYGTAKELYAQISSSIVQIDPAGAWGAPCDELDSIATTLTFKLGTEATAGNFTIPADNFNLGPYPGQTGICQTIFNNPIDPFFAPDGAPVWIIGSPLLKYYYTVWDGINLEIGWGKISASVETP